MRLSRFILSLGLLAVWLSVGASRGDAADDKLFADKIKPFLAKHCNDCHGGAEPEQKMAFDAWADAAAARKQPRLWQKIEKVLKSGKMPPKDHAKPDKADVDRVLTWIESDVLKLDCNAPRDPGRVTIRRLNRHEYNNTIRDLVGVDFRPGDDFPVDDSGYGFDNIGDVLSTSPLLLEKYLSAAETITAKAIKTDGLPDGPTVRYAAEKLKSTGGAPALGMHVLNTEGTIVAPHEFAKSGTYILRVRCYGQQAGDEPAKMGVRLDDKDLDAEVIVREQAREPMMYQKKIDVQAGKREILVSFLNDYYNPEARRRKDRNLIVDYIEIQGPAETGANRPPETHARIIFTTPNSSGRSADACAKDVLRKFATRAFRRPATAAEVDRLAALVKQTQDGGDSFERGIQLAMQAVLVSPHFLFRFEQDQFPNDPDKSHLITEYELATRLSYFLWSSMPDDELLEQAEKGTLLKNLDAQTRRMLKDRKSRALVDNFAGQWLETRKLATVVPDSKVFAGFDDTLRADMRRETEMFFENVVREDRSLLELLDAKYTFVNERLAKHYGIDGVKGEEFRRVEMPGDRRGGILTQGSILTLTSNPTRTSPVKRGKWIMEQILGTPPPPPPENVPELAETMEAAATASLRQRMELHRKNASCASCHITMDALGFAFENFDGVGRWRDKDGKFPIDPAGQLPDGQKFKNPAELRTMLRASLRPQFARNVAEKMLTYATGRGTEFFDKCALDEIVGAADKHDLRFSAYVLAVVQSEPFQKRRAKRAE